MASGEAEKSSGGNGGDSSSNSNKKSIGLYLLYAIGIVAVSILAMFLLYKGYVYFSGGTSQLAAHDKKLSENKLSNAAATASKKLAEGKNEDSGKNNKLAAVNLSKLIGEPATEYGIGQ